MKKPTDNELERRIKELEKESEILSKTEEALKKNHDDLEKKIELRTSELIKINDRLKKEIEERKLVEDALRENEKQLKAILDATMDRIRYVDKDMRIIWANKASALGMGCSSEELTGEFCYAIYVGRDNPCEGCSCTMAKESGQTEKSILCKAALAGREEESFWVTYCVPFKDEKGEINRYIQIARDITEEKHAQDQIHSLSQQLMRVQENERHKISQDLHDVIGQNLSTLKIGYDTLFDNGAEVSKEIKQKIAGFSEILQETITEVRNMAYDLRPPGLDQLGLLQTLYLFCENFSQKNNIKTDFIASGMEGIQLDFDTEINIYRLVQEALNNIKKHAGAEYVSIKLVASHPHIILRIEDDGKGFDLQKQKVKARNKKRMGISSMEGRVGLLGGNIAIQSGPMKGTKISIEIPIKDQKR